MLVIGAGGFAKELLEVLYQNSLESALAFFDDVTELETELFAGTFEIVRSTGNAIEHFAHVDKRFILGLGNPEVRYRMFEKFTDLGGEMTGVISPHAHIGRNGNRISNGVTIMTNGVIEADNSISEGTLVHVGAFISHDVNIGKFCEISPHSRLLGAVKIGDFCSLGTGCTILPRVQIGNDVRVGAGAVVTKDVPSGCTVTGIPAVQK
ncbi:MAG: hexapeptide transferase [Acidobacteria bacterium]|nr:MAG: hexapeptide transferase [Acidobacteriota bacterium]